MRTKWVSDKPHRIIFMYVNANSLSIYTSAISVNAYGIDFNDFHVQCSIAITRAIYLLKYTNIKLPLSQWLTLVGLTVQFIYNKYSIMSSLFRKADIGAQN